MTEALALPNVRLGINAVDGKVFLTVPTPIGMLVVPMSPDEARTISCYLINSAAEAETHEQLPEATHARPRATQ